MIVGDGAFVVCTPLFPAGVGVEKDRHLQLRKGVLCSRVLGSTLCRAGSGTWNETGLSEWLQSTNNIPIVTAASGSLIFLE